MTVSNSKGSVTASASLTVQPTQTFQVLHTFTNGDDGAFPDSALILSGSTLHGTASNGGSSSNGTIFSVNNDGTGFRVLHGFTSSPTFTNANGDVIATNGDGIFPAGSVVLASNTLYGTALRGGPWGNGALFKINTDGTGFKVLHSFSDSGGVGFGTNSDGANPTGALLLSGDTLYGAGSGGGTSGNGTVFSIKVDGNNFTTLYSFTGGNDGAYPNGGLILSGNTLYGTTSGGGSSGNGTAFKMRIDGTGFTDLYTFSSGSGSVVFPTNSDGAFPTSGLVLSGNTLYGTATYGGAFGDGTLFSIKTNGTGFSNLHIFSATDNNGLNRDGAYPQAGLTLIGSTLYGTAQNGGSAGNGTVFAINTNGTGLTILHGFNDSRDGAIPLSGLVSSGNSLYGAAYSGGASNFGTIFSLWVQQPGAPQGSLKVTLGPAGAITAGAQWRVDGGEFQGSGTVVSNLFVGQHLLTFAALGGWATPTNQIVSVAANSYNSEQHPGLRCKQQPVRFHYLLDDQPSGRCGGFNEPGKWFMAASANQ